MKQSHAHIVSDKQKMKERNTEEDPTVPFGAKAIARRHSAKIQRVNPCTVRLIDGWNPPYAPSQAHPKPPTGKGQMHPPSPRIHWKARTGIQFQIKIQ